MKMCSESNGYLLHIFEKKKKYRNSERKLNKLSLGGNRGGCGERIKEVAGPFLTRNK